MILPTDEDATLPLYPGEEALDQPAVCSENLVRIDPADRIASRWRRWSSPPAPADHDLLNDRVSLDTP
jgi:hypothetical protein